MLKKNLPNIITITRIIGTLVFAHLKVLSVPFYIAYIYSGLSDVADGFIARKYNIESEFGRKLDSISDLFFYTMMVIKIWPYLVTDLPLYVWIMIYVILGVRVLEYIYKSIVHHELLASHNYLNKTTGALMFCLPFMIKTKKFVVYSTIVVNVALVAAIYEMVLNIKGKL